MAKNWLRNHQPITQKNAVFLKIEKKVSQKENVCLGNNGFAKKVIFLRIFPQMVDENLSLDCYEAIFNLISTN